MLVNIETFLLYSLINMYTYWLIYYLKDYVCNRFLKNILASDDKVREMLHKVLYKNSIDEILIRAIVSQFNSWEDINELYITERAEKNKFLKNILASDDKVREMLHKVFWWRRKIESYV